MSKRVLVFYTTSATLDLYPRSVFVVHVPLGIDSDHFPEQSKTTDALCSICSKCNIAAIPAAACRPIITGAEGNEPR
jgi:hypothetical protein